jgi:hypothetical protein
MAKSSTAGESQSSSAGDFPFAIRSTRSGQTGATHALLALPKGGRQTQSAGGHSSHASHASHFSSSTGVTLGHASHSSHVSHASHFSSSTSGGSAVSPVVVPATPTTQTTAAVAPKVTVLTATLTSGQERPNPSNAPAEAGGHFHAQLDGTTLKWTLTFTHLSGQATSAHVHLGGSGSNGAVVARLCGPCPAFVTGAAILTPSAAAAILAGRAYVNVDTAANPNGEIRGQIVRG